MKLKTICERELFAGFFGINERGDQPECGTEIIIEVDEESIEREGDIIRPCFSVECPGCHACIDWPQEWEIIEGEK